MKYTPVVDHIGKNKIIRKQYGEYDTLAAAIAKRNLIWDELSKTEKNKIAACVKE